MFVAFVPFLVLTWCHSVSSFVTPNAETLFQRPLSASLSRKLENDATSLTATVLSTIDTEATKTSKYFNFQGHKCYSEVTQAKQQSPFPFSLLQKQRPEIILIHGFGCSTLYWRETTKYLTNAGYTVHAVDLLGQGKSDKPGIANGIEYSIDLWSDMINEYINQNSIGKEGIVVMGNSLGSCVALTLAATNPLIEGVGMYNCGVGMNSRNLLKDPSLNAIQVVVFTALFDFLDTLIFDNIPLLTYVLNEVVTRDLLRNALTGLYACAADPTGRVTDDLVESFYLPPWVAH